MLEGVTPAPRTPQLRDRRFARVRLVTRTVFLGSSAFSIVTVGYLANVSHLHAKVTVPTTSTTTTTIAGSTGATGVTGGTSTPTTAPTTTTTVCTTSPSGTTTCY